MSSWKKAAKANQKTHRERHQPESRAHLGLLEKKKDYKLRAKDHNKKKALLKSLKRRAVNKNPDEFYFHMVNSETYDGVHHELSKDDEHTPEQILLMQSQDLRYVCMKRTMEMKKIEQLQAQLHMLDAANQIPNQHIFYVDSKEDAKGFDVAKHLDTHPSLLDRKINRMRLKDLEKMNLNFEENSGKNVALQRKRMYLELAKRVEREKELGIIQQKLEMKRHLVASGDVKVHRIKPASKNTPPVYKFH
ncbi:UNVERIFIED_CONTAM: hypothetical protein PYX00_002622 [Menopon gallinae]|uniref:U3 small nucleolar RNA-associated protein 11 n=1 Tax=Menopon gallinae TaxID=328185 RepID=A0AAW2HYL3_9NEOP